MPLKTEPGLDKVSLRSAENDVQGVYDLPWVWDYGQRGWEARFFLRQSLSDRLSSGKKLAAVPLSYLIYRLRSWGRRDSGLAVMRRCEHFIKLSVPVQSPYQRIGKQIRV